MSMYLNYEGIKGEATAEGHEQWMDIDTLSWGVSRALSAKTGTNQNREATSTTISEVTFTKITDNATPYLFMESCIGKGKEIKIHLTKTDDTLQSYIEYTLRDCMISSYTVNSDGERPIETISLSFTKIELRYIPHDDKNNVATPVSQIYDVSLGKMV